MNLTSLFGLLGRGLVLAFAPNRIFRWTRIPGVVVLMDTGVLMGPILGWARPDPFKDVTHAFGALLLILLLFEGGLNGTIAKPSAIFQADCCSGCRLTDLRLFSLPGSMHQPASE